MDMRGKSAALYGRFASGGRDKLAAEIATRGGFVTRDLTRRSDILVIGGAALSLIEAGHLLARLNGAQARRTPVYGQRRFAALIAGAAEEAPTLPLSSLPQTGLSADCIAVLAAFDIVTVSGEHCRFADAATLRTAAEIIGAGRSLTDAVRILSRARDLAPKGRHKIILGPGGDAALKWESGLTTLEGQGFLGLDEPAETLDDLFEAAEVAEAEGDPETAARLYERCARADKKDPIAHYNLGNVRLGAGAFDAAAMAYKLAIARDPNFVEARYNLAQAYEALGKLDAARAELIAAIAVDASYADAHFNLAQLELKRGEIAAAKAQFERYLAADPPVDWAAKARKAIAYCAARLSA